MSISKDNKNELIKKFSNNIMTLVLLGSDGILSERINNLTEHFKTKIKTNTLKEDWLLWSIKKKLLNIY